MESWILGLISAALSPVRVLAQEAADRIRGVYTAFTNALGRVRGAVGHWVDVGRGWANAQIRHATTVATRLRWFLIVALPQWAEETLQWAVRWAGDRINAAVALAQDLVGALRTWALNRVAEIIASLVAVRDYFLARVAEIRLDVHQLLDRVFGTLGTPERAAAWLLGPLIGLLVAWWWDHVEDLAELAWRRRRQLETRALAVVDGIIERIL